MDVGFARLGEDGVDEVVPSAHCLRRFRERMPVREPGVAEVATALIGVLESCHVVSWPPAWALSDRPAERWAVSADIAFPLARTSRPGRWLALTCLRRERS